MFFRFLNFKMLCRHKPGWAACFSNRIFSSLALSSALRGIPASSRGIILPWKGHLRKKCKKKKKFLNENKMLTCYSTELKARYHDQVTKLCAWSPLPLRKHPDAINIMCLIYSESQRNTVVIWMSSFKRPGSTACQVWNAASHCVVYMISLSCNNPI